MSRTTEQCTNRVDENFRVRCDGRQLDDVPYCLACEDHMGETHPDVTCGWMWSNRREEYYRLCSE